MRYNLLLFTVLLGCTDPEKQLPVDAHLSAAELIEAAGNASVEANRFTLLLEARDELGENDELRNDLNVLIPIVERWAFAPQFWEAGDQNALGEDGYLGGHFIDRILPGQQGEAVYPPVIDEDSEVYAIWAMYRGRMLIWAAIQNGLLVDMFFEEGRSLLGLAHARYPENKLIGMYLNEPIPWEMTALPEGPPWAIYQADAMRRLKAIIAFWIDERQSADGQFGGGWGDDVELWRWWTPTLIAHDSAEQRAAWTLLSENIFQLPRLAQGYSATVADVEHSAEDTADTLTPMQLIDSDPVWTERALDLVEKMTTIWTGENDRNRLQFKSAHIGADSVSSSDALACDTATHVRVMQPAFAAWQHGHDDVADYLSEWMSSWVQNSHDSDNGKPAGLLSSSMHFPTGFSGGTTNQWWNPVCHYSEKTFQYPRGMSLLMRALVQTAHATGEGTFLDPILHMSDLRRQQLSGNLPDDGVGSEDWAIKEAKSALRDALAKNRILNNDPSHDDILLVDGDAYMQFLISGDLDPLESALLQTVGSLSVDFEAYTHEVRFTDRALKFHSRFANQYGDSISKPNTDLLYSMLTGDPGDPAVLALPGVRWSGDGFSALVIDNRIDRFSAKLYAWSSQGTEVGAQLLRLESGPFELTLSCGDEIVSSQLNFGEALDLRIPIHTECNVTVDRLD